jgi:hypothetical protein
MARPDKEHSGLMVGVKKMFIVDKSVRIFILQNDECVVIHCWAVEWNRFGPPFTGFWQQWLRLTVTNFLLPLQRSGQDWLYGASRCFSHLSHYFQGLSQHL